MAKLDAMLAIMPKVGASDLHLTPQHQPMLRLHGRMVRHDKHPELSSKDIDKLLKEIIPDRNLEEYDRSCDTDFAYEAEGVGRFRVNVYRDRLGTSAALRLIPNEIKTLEELALPSAVTDFCHLPKGIVVVTGPTGSGKSTTLAAMLDYINRTRSQHIITIEDPVEFVHRSQGCLIHQREVGTNTTSFRRALRAALREDPDVVLVGEMRDLETMRSAIEMAATGHLVLGTLHTDTAAGTVDRIIDQYPHAEQQQIRTMLATSLKGVVAQTLLRTRDGNGRVAAFEILAVTPGVANNIREGKTHAIASAIQTGAKYGMIQLNDAIMELVERRKVEPKEAYLKAANKSDMLARFQAKGVPFDPATIGLIEAAEGEGVAAPTEQAAPRVVKRPRREDGGYARKATATTQRKAKTVKFDDFESFRAARLSDG
jgi:twitching motility protein PilT